MRYSFFVVYLPALPGIHDNCYSILQSPGKRGMAALTNASFVVTDLQSLGGVAITITTLTSRELNQDITRAKRAARNGPVFITERGKSAHVLLSIEEYQRLTKQHRNIADSLAMPEVAAIEFEPQRVTVGIRPAGFS